LDLAVDRLYRKAPFKDDAERVSFLFEMYKEVITKIKS
ncbi:MAG: type IIL restriction-modification enzyme MmeI, partial [Treponema sp.]